MDTIKTVGGFFVSLMASAAFAWGIWQHIDLIHRCGVVIGGTIVVGYFVWLQFHWASRLRACQTQIHNLEQQTNNWRKRVCADLIALFGKEYFKVVANRLEPAEGRFVDDAREAAHRLLADLQDHPAMLARLDPDSEPEGIFAPKK